MGDPRQSRSLTLYTREACGLCDYMVLALELMRPRYNFRYVKVDVDTDRELTERYGLRVPVLVDHEREICAATSDPAVLEAYLANISDRVA